MAEIEAGTARRRPSWWRKRLTDRVERNLSAAAGKFGPYPLSEEGKAIIRAVADELADLEQGR